MEQQNVQTQNFGGYGLIWCLLLLVIICLIFPWIGGPRPVPYY